MLQIIPVVVNFGKMLRLRVWCILVKCRDSRIFPGTIYRFPFTKNYSASLIISIIMMKDDFDQTC